MTHTTISKILFLGFLSFIFTSAIAQTNKKNILPKKFDESFTKKLNDSIPALGSFIVSQNDKIVYKKYFHGASKDSTFDVKSVTKSVTSILAGIAKDKGLLTDLDTPVLSILPEYNVSRSKYPKTYEIEGKREMDSIRNTVTLRHLFTMRGGFKWKENGGEISLGQFYSSDPVRFVLDLPFEEYPGDTFNYNSGETHVFAVALAKIVNSNLEDFANKNLFGPLKINIEEWYTDVLNRNIGGSEIFMKPLDMQKIGSLVLNKGKYENKQIVSEKWIEESTSEQVKLDSWDVLPNANGYGYYWWRRTTNGHQAFVAVGYGGQLICIVPDLKMVITTTCFLNEKNRGRIELKKLHGFIDEVTK